MNDEIIFREQEEHETSSRYIEYLKDTAKKAIFQKNEEQ